MNSRAACFVAVVVFACGGPKNGASGDECASLQKSARAELDRAFDANQSCTADADCTYVEWSTKCAVRNTRLIAKSGRPKLHDVQSNVEANECQTFATKNCVMERDPPAEPPRSPKCELGRCTH